MFYGYVFCNVMLIIIVGFLVVFVGMFFIGVLLIEYIFLLDGFGLFGFELVINWDYLVVFGILFIFMLIGMLLKLVFDLIYMWVDLCIDFEWRVC